MMSSEFLFALASSKKDGAQQGDQEGQDREGAREAERIDPIFIIDGRFRTGSTDMAWNGTPPNTRDVSL